MSKKSVFAWTLVFPDGELATAYTYVTKRDLIEHSPAAVYGDCRDWKQMTDEGFRMARVQLVVSRVYKN